jgi:type VI secretion system protein ImpM
MTGFFGKLPTHGDFVHRELPDVFLNRWDAWLQEVIAASQAQLGQHWLDAYLTSPIWRFVLDRDVIDGMAWAGILMPSVDRVGRYFPFTVATRIDVTDGLAQIGTAADSWFAEVESQALAALDRDVIDLDQFALALPAWTIVGGPPHQASFVDADGEVGGAWEPAASMGDALLRWADWHVAARLAPASLWWSSGSARVAPQWRLFRGLPKASAYQAMLGEADVAGPGAGATLLSLPCALSFDCAVVTHPGHVRRDNQDAWLSRPDVGVWVVADGMGGHRDGAWASQRVVAEIDAALRPRGSLAAVVDDVRRALERVNAELRASGRDHRDTDDMAGSTVVVLIVHDGAAGVLWAGDSRAYRLRDGVLVAVTEDHVERTDPDRPASEITRAVGAADELALEFRRVDLAAGDGWLLCSDGVHGQVADGALARVLAGRGDALAVAAAIQGEVLRGRAPDNLTAVVVSVVEAGVNAR